MRRLIGLGLITSFALMPFTASSVAAVQRPVSGAMVADAATDPPRIGNCPIFPPDNWWNTDITNAPVDPNSDNYIAHMNPGATLRYNFRTSMETGVPYNVVRSNTPRKHMHFRYADSDQGDFPIPDNPLIQQPNAPHSDRHLIVVDEDACMLYEAESAQPAGDTDWDATGGATWDLRKNELRPDGKTSADAAGLPIFAGLIRYDEVASGSINHAIRFALRKSTQDAWVHPATHAAGHIDDPNYPPFGARVRLKASFDLSRYHGQALVILTALKHYGMYLADNGYPWQMSGAPDPRWNLSDLKQLNTVPWSAFEVLKLGPIYYPKNRR